MPSTRASSYYLGGCNSGTGYVPYLCKHYRHHRVDLGRNRRHFRWGSLLFLGRACVPGSGIYPVGTADRGRTRH